MVVPEHYTTRKPVEYTLIALFVILILMIPFYICFKVLAPETPERTTINNTYEDLASIFGLDNDISSAEKTAIFEEQYAGKIVNWSGEIQFCDTIGLDFVVTVDQNHDGESDVTFVTADNCTIIPSDSEIEYSMILADRKIDKFTGMQAEVISWD